MNTIYNKDCVKGLKKFDKNYFDLCIADPPYFRVVNQKWDYEWRTEQEYIDWSLTWIKEVYRTLRYGGTFYLFGYFRTLALLVQYLLDMGFDLRQQIIINKGIQAVAGRATKKYKMYPNVTESLLFLIKDNIPYVKKNLKRKQKELRLSSKEINEALGVKSNGGGMWSIYTGENICKQFPTKEIWLKLSKILHFKKQYETIAQTYNTELGITDVWGDINFRIKNRVHPTQKPSKLIQRLITVSSNKGDYILDPFAGSGEVSVNAKVLKRNCVAFEKDSEYFDIAISRIEEKWKTNYI